MLAERGRGRARSKAPFMTRPHTARKHNNTAKGKRNSGDALVSLDNAGVKNGDSWRVRHISLAISRGEIITLIGPNGSGKSTTAKLAAGILPPSEGAVARLPQLKIGYVPQKLHFDKSLPLTVRRLMCLTGPLPEAELQSALRQTGMAHKEYAEVSTLSGGELQRVLLARAAARKPDLLILDEPLQGVDFSWEATLYQWISDNRSRLNCGILLISHDLHIVMAASDRVFCLNGHICCSGKPQEVAASDEYNSLFSRRPGANKPESLLTLYQHSHNHKHD